jgi:hypothetical protein
MGDKIVRNRKPNFTDADAATQVESIESRYDIISSKFSDKLHLVDKKKAWEDVTEAVNVESKVKRTVDEIKKKWDDMKTRTKKKASELKKKRNATGGGDPPDPTETLTEIEMKIVAIIGETIIHGIEGGMDSEIRVQPDVQVEVETSNENQSDEGSHEVDSCVSSRATTPITGMMPGCSNRLSIGVGMMPVCSKQLDEARLVNDKANKTKSSKPPRIEVDTLNEYSGNSRRLIQIEEERLEVEKKRLKLETRRLEIEEERLKLEQQRFAYGYADYHESGI